MHAKVLSVEVFSREPDFARCDNEILGSRKSLPRKTRIFEFPVLKLIQNWSQYSKSRSQPKIIVRIL